MSKRATAAFSLAEVALALGVVSFALVSMLGLLGVGIKAGRESSEDTAMTSMISQVVGSMRASPPSTPGAANFYFDGDGLPLPNATGAVYQCAASAAPPLGTEVPGLSAKFLKMDLVFTWPASAPTPPHTQTVHASLLLP